MLGIAWLLPPPSRMSKVAAKIALLVVSLAVTLLVCEAFVRVEQFGIASLWPPLMESTHPIGTSGLIQAASSREMLYELKPNLDAYYKLKRFQTNSAGLRDREYALDKPPGTFRAAVIGDSFSMPAGVAIEDAYHSRVEAELDRRSEATRFEFLNFAVDGYQLPQYLSLLEHKIPPYRPDLILVGFCPNDYVWISAFEQTLYGKPYVVLPETHPFFEIHLIPWIQSKLDVIRRRKRPQQPWAAKLDDELRAHVEQHLAKMSALAHASGAPLVVAFLSPFSGGFDVLKTFLRELAARYDFHFVDVSAAFAPEEDRKYRIYEADAHPNAEANAIFADVILRYLLDNDLVPLGTTPPGTSPRPVAPAPDPAARAGAAVD